MGGENLMTAPAPQRYFKFPCGFTCQECSLTSTCDSTNPPPCSRPHTRAPTTLGVSCIKCFNCGKQVSTYHNSIIFRAIATCPECIESGKDIDPEHDATIRNTTLKEFENRLSSRKIIEDGEGERCSAYELIEDMLSESLRTPTQEAHQR